MKTPFFDSHTHTNYSHDSRQDIENLITDAIEKKLMGIAITDHCEFSDEEWDFCQNHIPTSLLKARELKEKYHQEIIISVGVELGQEILYPQRAKEFLKDKTFDFILGTCHNTYKGEDYYFFNPENDPHVIMTDYFNLLLDISKKADMDSLAHLTYPVRYIEGIHEIPVDLNRYKSIIDEILKALISREIALELNTSGYRQPLGRPMPDIEIVGRYKELGGKLLTLGSDAHQSGHICHSFDIALNELKKLGFTEYFYYQNRCPNSIKIL